jgi:hypothetical protein
LHKIELFNKLVLLIFLEMKPYNLCSSYIIKISKLEGN